MGNKNKLKERKETRRYIYNLLAFIRIYYWFKFKHRGNFCRLINYVKHAARFILRKWLMALINSLAAVKPVEVANKLKDYYSIFRLPAAHGQLSLFTAPGAS